MGPIRFSFAGRRSGSVGWWWSRESVSGGGEEGALSKGGEEGRKDGEVEAWEMADGKGRAQA